VGVLVMSNDVSDKVADRNQLQQVTEELQAINEEAAVTNEELAATNEELTATQQTLEETIKDLEQSEQRVRAQQRRLEDFFMQAPAGITILGGPDLVFELVNPLYQQLFPARDLLHKKLLDALPELEGAPILNILQEVYQTGKTFEGRELLIPLPRTAAGPLEDRYFDFIYQARLNEERATDGILVFVIEVTDQVKTRQDIEQGYIKQSRLAAIVSNSDDTILSKTLQGIITTWNAAAERMFGYTEEEAIGQHISLIIPPSRLSEEDFIIGQVKAGNKVDHFETVRIAKNGREIPISLTVSPITDANGTIIGASKIARDISEKQKDEQRKNDFIGMVSHELKTPLTSLTALIQMTGLKLAKSDDEFLAGAMGRANAQVKKMSKMINGFLNVSRLESGKIAIDKQRFDMATLIHEVGEEIKTTYNTHEIVFAPVEPTWVDADPDKIGHVMSNLINNAVKYSPARSRIDVACQTVSGEARVSVKDRGVGISPGDAAHLFDRYYRVEDVNTRHISGFGIGLYLSAEIINRHEGKIWVESEPGSGSTFHFSLPLAE
jgi:PAS domain S-box-containing protein